MKMEIYSDVDGCCIVKYNVVIVWGRCEEESTVCY